MKDKEFEKSLYEHYKPIAPFMVVFIIVMLILSLIGIIVSIIKGFIGIGCFSGAVFVISIIFLPWWIRIKKFNK